MIASGFVLSLFCLVGFIFWFRAVSLGNLASPNHGLNIAIHFINSQPQIPWKRRGILAQHSQPTPPCFSFTLIASCASHWAISVNRKICCSGSQMSTSEAKGGVNYPSRTW